jgi:predicted amidohydrolase
VTPDTRFVCDSERSTRKATADESGLRVAAAQGESLPGELEANVKTAVALVEEAAGGGARVVVLPELFLTGYDPESWSDATCLGPDDVAGPALAPLHDVAARTGTVVVVGAAVSTGSTTRTISILVADRTGVRVAYDKQHLTDEEKDFFTPGEHGTSIVVDDWELGLSVCYDGNFAEHAAAAAKDGATAYLCPAAYYTGSEHRRDLYYAARALDNGIYVVLSGLAGRCGSREFNGGSAVYDPEGRPLDRVGAEPGAVAYADLDRAEVTRVQQMNPILRDRREDLGVRRRFELS